MQLSQPAHASHPLCAHTQTPPASQENTSPLTWIPVHQESQPSMHKASSRSSRTLKSENQGGPSLRAPLGLWCFSRIRQLWPALKLWKVPVKSQPPLWSSLSPSGCLLGWEEAASPEHNRLVSLQLCSVSPPYHLPWGSHFGSGVDPVTPVLILLRSHGERRSKKSHLYPTKTHSDLVAAFPFPLTAFLRSLNSMQLFIELLL